MNNDIIINNVINKYLTEVGVVKVRGLRKIDDYFQQLRKTESQRNAVVIKQKLEKHLEKVFGPVVFIDLHYTGPYATNCGVIPVLTSQKNRNKDIFTDTKIKIFSVKKIHILLGMVLLKKVVQTPEQMTAIILHEFGHVKQCFEKNTEKLYRKHILLHFFETLNLIPIISSLVLIPYILTSRSLFFTQHMREYDADDFAAKYGYGDELRDFFQHSHNIHEQYRKERRLALSDILNSLRILILSNSHPEFEKRANELSKNMKNKYADKYPNSNKIKKILDQSG